MSFKRVGLNGAPVYISKQCSVFTPHFKDDKFFTDFGKLKRSFIRAAIQPDYHYIPDSLPVGSSIMTYDVIGNDINCGVRAIDLKITKE